MPLLRYRHLDLFMGALFERQLTTLAELSARRGGGCDDDKPSPKQASLSRRSVLDAQQDARSSAFASPMGAPGKGLRLPGRLLSSSSSSSSVAAAAAADAALAGEPAGGVPGGGAQASPAGGRCFKRAHLCRLRARDEDSLVAAAHSLSRHYEADIRQATDAGPPDPWPDGSRSGSRAAMRVVFASRPGSDARSLLNEAELLAECNAWMPPDGDGADDAKEGHHRRMAEGGASAGQGAMPKEHSFSGRIDLGDRPGVGYADGHPQPQLARQRRHRSLDASSDNVADSARDGAPAATWGAATCVSRVFGSSAAGGMLADMGFMAGADVLVCIHGAACLNAYFMGNGSSLVRMRVMKGCGGIQNPPYYRVCSDSCTPLAAPTPALHPPRCRWRSVLWP